MVKLSLFQVILILSCSTASIAQQISPLADTSDAYSILQGKYKANCEPNGDVQAIVQELRAIRKAVPAVAQVHEAGSYMPQQLLLGLAKLLLPSFTPEQKKARIQQMSSRPLATGIGELDNLNKQYGAVRIEWSVDDWVSIHFGKPLDMICVMEAYKKLIDEVQPNFIYGDGDHIYRAQKSGEPVHYVFRIGSGDCPAGCTEETLYYFNLYPEGQGYRIAKIDGPAPYHTLWGYPHRFPVRIFESFDDLLKNTESADWSMRLHAVSALGGVYAGGTSGLGEDQFGDGEADAAIVKRTAAIMDQIDKSPDVVKGVLERIAANDSDDDVRRVAKMALQDHEERGKK